MIDEYDYIVSVLIKGIRDYNMKIPVDIRKDKNFEQYLVDACLSYINANRTEIIGSIMDGMDEDGFWSIVRLKIFRIEVADIVQDLKHTGAEPDDICLAAGQHVLINNPLSKYSIKESMAYIQDYLQGHKLISMDKGEGKDEDYDAILELLREAERLYVDKIMEPKADTN